MSNKTKTNVTKDEAILALVPKLRFPEFRDAVGWKSIPLNCLAIPSKQKNRDEKIDRVLTNSAEFGVLDQRDFFDKDIATQGKLEGYFVVELGSYVYNPRISSTAPVGPISKNKIGTGIMSPLYTVFKFKDESNDFYEHFFKTSGWHAYMRQASSTGARHDRMAISCNDFMAMPLPVSSPSEQKKIAECLSSMDELMAAQARKVDALKAHKKGLMQQLFHSAGETQPHIRFPEFQNAGGWEKKKLGDVALFFKGKGISKADITTSGRHPCIRYGELYTRYGEVINEIISSTDVADADLFFSLSNDVIIPASGETKLDIAKASCVMHDNVALGSDLNVIRTNHNGVFLSYYLNGPKRLDIAKVAQGNTVVHLYPSQLEKLAVFLPEIHEQLRIATCMNSLDALISVETQNLESLKTHKKGLMQQLFPTLEAVEE